MRTLIRTIPMALVFLACDLSPDQGRAAREAPLPAALLAPGQDASLLEQLRVVEQEISLALEGEPTYVYTAEARTDQLLHAPRDVDWLATGYLVEARLRQIQAKADAIVAMLRRGTPLLAVESDLITLRTAVQDLQRQLELPGGGPAPPRLDQLLDQDPLRDARTPLRAAGAPATPTPAPTGPRPLGQPVGQPQNDLD
jgi:hypothetical protein